MTQGCGGILLTRNKSGGGYVTVKRVTWLLILQLIERRGEARWFYSGSGSIYDTSDQIQDRTGLTGTPLGAGLAIVLFIHEIAFVNIWPNQQARWVLWMYSQDSSDIRYIKCKHDAPWAVSNAHSNNRFARHVNLFISPFEASLQTPDRFSVFYGILGGWPPDFLFILHALQTYYLSVHC